MTKNKPVYDRKIIKTKLTTFGENFIKKHPNSKHFKIKNLNETNSKIVFQQKKLIIFSFYEHFIKANSFNLLTFEKLSKQKININETIFAIFDFEFNVSVLLKNQILFIYENF